MAARDPVTLVPRLFGLLKEFHLLTSTLGTLGMIKNDLFCVVWSCELGALGAATAANIENIQFPVYKKCEQL